MDMLTRCQENMSVKCITLLRQFCIEKLECAGANMFSSDHVFVTKHKLWVPVRTTFSKRFSCVHTINVVRKSIKTIIFSKKNVQFYC